MGRHKLLLPWRGGTVLSHVLRQWTASAVDRVVVTLRADDRELAHECSSLGVDVVTAAARLEDMKASAGLALEYIRQACAPSGDDVWLVGPADLPRLRTAAINAVLAAYVPREPSIVAPTFAGRRGHPTLFPWRFAEQVSRLSDNQGLSALVRRAPVREVPWGDDSILRDIDTPRDYALALAAHFPES